MRTLLSVMTALVIALFTINVSKAECMSPSTGPQIVKEADWLVEKLKLKGDTAINFVKIYTDYRSEMVSVREQNKCKEPEVINGKKGSLSDSDIDENIRKGFESSRKMIDVREKYYKKFKKVMSPRKIEKMFRYEKKIMERKREEMKKREKYREQKHEQVDKRRKKVQANRKKIAKKRAAQGAGSQDKSTENK
ncbi:MAG: hypothetical protein K2M07_01120 [Muribaculaceae bacterium]|nr:hypothetical protein [Muribaculaceae bacterium]